MSRYEGACDEWTGAGDSYGQKWVSGRLEYVHRLAWIERHGPIPHGQCVLHRCDNPPCRNVDHLFLGDRGVNNRDMVAKGRHWSQRKKRCPQNHPLEGDNLDPAALAKGRRRCRTCRREQTRRAQRRYLLKAGA